MAVLGQTHLEEHQRRARRTSRGRRIHRMPCHSQRHPSNVWFSRAKKSLVRFAIIGLSKSSSCGLVVVCTCAGRFIQKLSFKTFAEIPKY